MLLLIGGGVDTTTALTSAAFVHLGRDLELRERLIAEPALLPHGHRGAPARRTRRRAPTPAPSPATSSSAAAGCGPATGCCSGRRRRATTSWPSPTPTGSWPTGRRTATSPSASGIHRCVGAHLARLEVAEILTAVLERIPDYELGEVVEYPNWAAIGGWAAIPVTVRS